MNVLKKNLTILFFLVVANYFMGSTRAFGSLGFEDAVSPELAPSGRALAMGNAFIAKADDAMAAFYNPAGLGSVRKTHFHISNFHVEFNRGWLSLGTDGKLTDSVGNIAKAFSLDGIRELLLTNKGTFSHSKFSLVPNFTMRFFSLGYLYHKQLRATLGEEPGDQFEFADRLDHGPYAAVNFSFMGGILKLGVTAMYLTRKELVDQVDPNTTLEPADSDYSSGSMFYSVIGGKLTLPFAGLPTFSATVHNGEDKKFEGDNITNISQAYRNVVLGVSITPRIAKRTTFHIEINYKDASGQYGDIDRMRKLGFGFEFGWYNLLFLRLGYGDGYGSAGLGLKSKNLDFDLTTYAVDTTESGFRGEEDRRFSLSVSSGF